MIIERYTPAMAAEWDAFVDISRNGTFLHRRGYMDYHAHRFADHSLVARDAAGGALLAVMPAHTAGTTLASHNGLSYGGWLMAPRHLQAAEMLELFRILLAHMRSHGLDELLYRPVPHIYHRQPAEDDLYALWRLGATPCAMGASSTIDLRDPLPPDRGMRGAINRAMRSDVAIGQSHRWADFWAILEEVLGARHDTRPVHTLEEIKLLHSRFPDRIRLYTASRGGRVLAGTVVYDTGRVVHTQYIAAGDEARRERLLPAIYSHIIQHDCAAARYFDFGVSTEQGGAVLNHPLDTHKYRMGGRCTVYPAFRLTL